VQDNRKVQNKMMSCTQCGRLVQAFDSALGEYLSARANPFFDVSTELAASKQVDMERAKHNLKEHRVACSLSVTPTQ
jgi:hypothetical protein